MDRHSRSNMNVTPQFVLAGDAIFTVSNGSGEHATFKVSKAKPNTIWPEPAWFIKVLAGPDNEDENNYRYMGKLVVPGGYSPLPDDPGPDPKVKLTSKSFELGLREEDKLVRVARWMLRAIWQVARGEYRLPIGYSIKHAGKCGRCGRTLTAPASIDTGLGETCANEAGIEWQEVGGS